MDRSVVKLQENKVQKKIDRWQKIVKEAAEQSYRLLYFFEATIHIYQLLLNHYKSLHQLVIQCQYLIGLLVSFTNKPIRY
jgi:RsmE family RNA methyltransferase